ncbi:MAG: prolipoprotein diacylglyceryl transferase [Ignavibacteriae bacterium]|nr:MAG: prolipoprotein diacylglyceryl transferase [Ignavibacteriota bacterium]
MITWDVSPEIFSVGPIHIRWYGILFAASFLIGLQIMTKIFQKENKSENDLNDLFIYMLLGTIIGARLGHCLFYNPVYYLSNPLEIIMVWKGGLASHGAAIGIVTAIYLYSKKKTGQSFLWVMDRVVITVALAGFFIRTGNLMNSEIIGSVTDVPWAFKFVRAYVSDPQTPRHPAQLYEALTYLSIFFLLLTTYFKSYKKLKEGYLFGLFLILVFTARFIIEFFKENQSSFEQGMVFNMGQLLSIPLVIWGIYLLFFNNNEKPHIK